MSALVTLLLAALPAQFEVAEQPAPLASTTIGIEAVVFFHHDGPPLAIEPVDPGAPVLARIAAATPSYDGSLDYELRFLAMRPGTFDLSELLELEGGLPAQDLPPLWVEVRSLLPSDHAGELGLLSEPEPPVLGGYRVWLLLLGILWLTPLAWLLLVKLRREDREEQAVVAPLSLADQLRPLVEAAVDGRISREGQARLELLLLTYWRERLGMRARPVAEALGVMRRHATAGELLRTVEGWLHRPQGQGPDAQAVALALEPYRRVSAVEPEAATAQAELAGHLSPEVRR